MTRSGGPSTLFEAVRKELARLGGGPAEGAGIAAVVEVWPAAVGDSIARNAWPARIARDGTLVVHVASSAWAFELTQLEARIRDKLGPSAPDRLRFVVGPIPEPAQPSAESVPRSRQPVPNPSPEHVRRGTDAAAAIEDLALRELVARAAASSLARGEREAVPTDPSDTIRSA